MSNTCHDIEEMLDTLRLPKCVEKFDQMLGNPQLGSYSPTQFLRELLKPQYIATVNKRFADNLRKSSLLETDAKVENLRTGNGRTYNDTTVRQVLTYRFADDRMNVGVYGVTGAGKSYFLAAVCIEACRLNYSCKFVDYCDLLDELLSLNQAADKTKYRKRVKYYAKFQLLFIDGFAISRYDEEGITILYHLIKMRTDLHKSTLFSCQYSPEEWGKYLGKEPDCYGKLDGIRRRLSTGYTVIIERSN